jgi:hypothetical protein
MKCEQCRQPLEEWEAGSCEGCGSTLPVGKPYLCESAHGVKPYQAAPGRRLEGPAAAARRQQQYVGSSSTSAADVGRQQM